MAAPNLSFRLVPGLRPSERRGVGFLEGHPELDAGNSFDSFADSTRNVLRRHMEWWVALKDGFAKKYHGFEGDYRHLFVFKHVAQGVRLYGFKCHPLTSSNPRFELVVLCIFDSKFEDHTNQTVLRQVEQWRRNVAAHAAISRFPDFRSKEESSIRRR